MTNPRHGDPEGRRLAHRRAMHLAEAGRVARALIALLKRAEFDIEACLQLVEQIAGQERDALGKAFGHVEFRTRFKGRSGHALLEGRPANFLHIDESGISSPERTKRRATFTMGAVAMDLEDVHTYRHAADEIKKRFFGTTELTFHEPLMRHRDGPYALSGSIRRQQQFDDAVADLISSSRFVAFGVAVRKTVFESEFVATGIDGYLPTNADAVAIHMLLERYVDFLAMDQQPRLGKVIFESQGAREDADRQFEVARVLVDGTQWISEKVFRHWVAPGVQLKGLLSGGRPDGEIRDQGLPRLRHPRPYREAPSGVRC